MLCFVVINSILSNLLCVWILIPHLLVGKITILSCSQNFQLPSVHKKMGCQYLSICLNSLSFTFQQENYNLHPAPVSLSRLMYTEKHLATTQKHLATTQKLNWLKKENKKLQIISFQLSK